MGYSPLGCKELYETEQIIMILYDGYIVIHLSKPIECTAPRVKPNVSYRLWIIMMYQCRFINCKNLLHWWQMLMMGLSMCASKG